MRDALLIERAKDMRREATEPEQRLRFAPRAERLCDIKSRRQKVIGPYIVDLASRDPMLVVEIDGDTHAERVVYDADHPRYLERQGDRAIRFTNADVMTNLDGVLIANLEQVRTPPLPSLSPEGERAS